MKILNLKVNHEKNPIGFEFSPLTLSWQVDAIGLAKKSTRVTISKEDEIVFDSGEDCDIDGICYNPKLELCSRTRYEWTVTVTAINDEKASATAFFETGKMDEAWTAKWIKASFDKSPYFTKEFEAQNTENARLYAVGRGVFEVYCNGQKVGNDYLDPGFNSYDLWEQSHTYDISSYLVKGKNVIGFTLGDAWYKGSLGWLGENKNIFGDTLMIISEIHVDGKIIDTNSSWKCTKSPVVETSLYDGETFDARLENENWCTVLADFESQENAIESGNDTSKVQDKLRPALKKHEVFEPVVIITPKNEMVLDFGQNLAGWVEGDVSLECGKSITLTHGEILQDDCFYNGNYRTAKVEYKYISNGKKGHFRPRFTFFGFRYVKVEGDVSAKEIQNFKAYAIYSQMDTTGIITTGHELVNKLISNVMWGQKGNFVDVPTDCPQRDERMGWTGDTQIFAPTASYNMETYSFYKKHMRDLMLEQEILDGGIPFIIPSIRKNVEGTILAKHSSCAWGDVATVLPWTMYEYFGDKELLKKHYPAMKGWVEYIKGEDEKAGGQRLWQTGFHFADWLALDNFRTPNKPFGATDEYYVASVWYAYSTLLTAKAAKAIGNEDDAKYYDNLYNEICQAVRDEYFTKNGRCAIDTQTAKVLAIQMGIVNGDDKKRVAKDLVKQLEANDMKLETGFCGTPFLCTALSQMGYDKEAYTILLREELPGWLYEVLMGATTIWERWNSVMPDGKMNPQGMNSLNHYAYGAVKEWIYKDVCGLRLHEGSVGFKAVDITPKPDARLGHAKCTYNSVAGIYEISWKIENDKVIYNITVPFDRIAYVTLPNKNEVKLISGEYEFEGSL